MVQQQEIIEGFRLAFNIVGGSLVWSTRRRKSGKVAGARNRDGYIEIRLKILDQTKLYFAHQIIFAMTNGYFAKLVDHIDRDTWNNYPSNLRDANKQINAINTGLATNNSTGVKGVHFHLGKWDAFINIRVSGKKKKIHLGRFKTIEDATTARQQAERDYWSNL